MSVETVSNCWRKKISTFRYFCQDSQRGPNLLSDSLLTTQNRSATRSASGRGHWPTPPTWIRLSLSHNGSAPELFWALGSVVFVSSCWWTSTSTTSFVGIIYTHLIRFLPLRLGDGSPNLQRQGPTRTQSSDYFTCWLLSGLNQQPGLHFSNKKRSWEVFKLWKTKMVVRWRITWHDLDRSSVLLSRTRRRVSEDESWNIPP